ncbi:MAG: hypothetical protein HZB47_14395 [Nitrosomonadales bacterium]|nr:hypothetical protein [Nitrosomonadales bacterium]
MNTADMLIYIHPELDVQKRADLQKTVEGRAGVDCAEFDPRSHNHAMMVRYDPDAIQSMQILDIVRKADPVATMVGM